MKSLTSLILAASALLLSGTHAATSTILIDFGRSDGTNGNTTTSPTGGNYWNNVSSALQGVTIGTGATNMVSTTGTVTTIDIATTTAFETNGILNGGLLNATQSGLLGNFAVNTATQDFFYKTAGAAGTILLSNLDSAKTYVFTFFASRWAADNRFTTYTVTGNGTPTVGSLQSSGTDIGTNFSPAAGPTGSSAGNTSIYDGNDRNTLTLGGTAGIAPYLNAGDYQISIDLQNTAGGFAYINALQIDIIPEPGAALLGGLGILTLLRRRRPV